MLGNSLIQEVMDFRNWDYKYTLKKFDFGNQEARETGIEDSNSKPNGRDFKTKAGRTTITSH
jgi:hypothetical protein